MKKFFIFLSISFLSIAISMILFNFSKIMKHSMNFVYQWKVSNYKQYIDVDINKYYEERQFENGKAEENLNEIKSPTNRVENASFFLLIYFLDLYLYHCLYCIIIKLEKNMKN